MTCACGYFYIGKTKRELRLRIKDHVYLSSNEKMTTPISRHIGMKHNFDISVMKFVILDHMPLNERGGNLDKSILLREAKGIFDLKVTKPPGLNETFSLKYFL